MNIDFEKIVEGLVNILSSAERTAEYEADTLQYYAIGGWTGQAMAPITRKAFLKCFGPQVLSAEVKAKDIILERQNKYNASQFHQHEIAADEQEGVPAEGDFVWITANFMKYSEGGLDDVIDCHFSYEDELSRQLCKVEKVIHVSAEEFADCRFPTEAVRKYGLRGGAGSDDNETDPDNYDTYYAIAAAVVDPNGRYYLIDAEGFDYARYIFFPYFEWQEMFAPEIEAYRKREEQEKAEIEAERQRATEEARKAYYTRCEKWQDLMVDVGALDAEKDHAYYAYSRNGCRTKSEEYKSYRAASRALMTAQKKNIAAMVKKAFPKLKFSVKVSQSYLVQWEITYTDGPTKEEFENSLDLGLFAYCAYGRSVDDNIGFCDFAMAYLGGGRGRIDVFRKISEGRRKEVQEKLKANFPILETDPRGWSEDEFKDLAYKVMPQIGMHAEDIRDAYKRGYCSLGYMTNLICKHSNYYNVTANK